MPTNGQARRELAAARAELAQRHLTLPVLDAMLWHPQAQRALTQLTAVLDRVETQLARLDAHLEVKA